MSKKVAIILINWNSYDLMRDTLNSLRKVSYKDLDLIVVDNGSSDGSGIRLEADFSEIIMLKSSSNKGFTGGNNIGFQYAMKKGYTYVMMLNNDVEVETDFIEPLVYALDENNRLGAVQPLIYFHHDRELIWNAGSVRNSWTGETITLDYNERDAGHERRWIRRNVDWLTGCAFLVRTEILKKVGSLKEEYFMYFEDVDFSFRIRQAGYELGYEPSSVIYHIAGVSSKSIEKGREGYLHSQVHYLNARNRIWILKRYTKSFFVPTVFIYQVGYILSVGMYFILRRRFAKLGAWLRGVKDGILINIYK
jgi:GT2 family glycosyltransferase